MRWDFSKSFGDEENVKGTKKLNDILQYKRESLPMGGIAWEHVLDYEAYQEQWKSHVDKYFRQLRRGHNERRIRAAVKNGEELDEEDRKVWEEMERRAHKSNIGSRMDTVSWLRCPVRFLWLLRYT